MRDVPSGDELAVSYPSNTSGACRDERLAELRFPCACAACSLTDEALPESNRRRARIEEIFNLIIEAVAAVDSSAIALVEERLAFLAEEGQSVTWDTVYAAWAYHQSVADIAEARSWAVRAAQEALIGLGRDSAEFQRYIHVVQAACAKY